MESARTAREWTARRGPATPQGVTLSAPAGGFAPLIATAHSRLARELGAAAVPPLPAASRLAALLERVVAWSRRVDLTAPRSAEELVDLYVADALVLAGAEPAAPGAAWVDVGTGGGAPGLVLAMLRPEVSLTLVEPRTKRAAFLRSAAAEVGATTARVLRERSDTLGGGGFQVALSRATLPPAEWLAEGARLATEAVWVLLARDDPPVLAGWRPAADLRYSLPYTHAGRRALRYVPAE